MSGICGIFQKDLSTDRDTLISMCNTMNYNGMENVESFIEDEVGLGIVSHDINNKRELLFINRMPSNVILHGNLYDLHNISSVLQNEGYENLTDTNIILSSLYDKFHDDFIDKLRGSFALAGWDSKRKRLLLATDRFGIEPIYYFDDGERLIFSTDIKAIIKCDSILKDINLKAIYHYLNFFYIPHPFSIFKGIKKLPPGHLLILENGRTTIRRYWDMQYRESIEKSETYYTDNLRDLIKEAVTVILESCKDSNTAGAFLSGGTDSSTLVGILSTVMDTPVKTFSIGFSEDTFNELQYARIAARHFGAEHHEYIVNAKDLIKALPAMIENYNEPFGNASAVATYYCARLAKDNGVDTLFAGDGGDELFGGNERYLKNKIFNIYHSLPHSLRMNIIENLITLFPAHNRITNKIRNFVKRANLPNPERHYTDDSFASDFFDSLFTEDMKHQLDKEASLMLVEDIYNQAAAQSELNKLLYLDLKTAIAGNDLVKVTQACKANGINVCFPYLDHKLAEFSGTIPAGLKLKGFNKRYIFKKIMKGFVPDEIINKKKHGFGLPIEEWLKTDNRIKEMAHDLLLSQRSIQRGYFNKEFLNDLLMRHQKSQWNYCNEIWALMMLELWHREYLD